MVVFGVDERGRHRGGDVAGLSGVDVVAQLHKHDLAQVPVLLMTGDAMAAAQLTGWAE